MTITVTAANIGSQQASKNAAVTLLGGGGWSSPATDIVQRNGTRTQTSVYRYKGDAWGETTLTVVETQQPAKAGVLNRRFQARLKTNIKIEDDVLDSKVITPYEVGIYWNSQSAYDLDVASVSRVLQTLFAQVSGSFDGTSGAPANTLFTNSALGITQNLT